MRDELFKRQTYFSLDVRTLPTNACAAVWVNICFCFWNGVIRLLCLVHMKIWARTGTKTPNVKCSQQRIHTHIFMRDLFEFSKDVKFEGPASKICSVFVLFVRSFFSFSFLPFLVRDSTSIWATFGYGVGKKEKRAWIMGVCVRAKVRQPTIIMH